MSPKIVLAILLCVGILLVICNAQSVEMVDDTGNQDYELKIDQIDWSKDEPNVELVVE